MGRPSKIEHPAQLRAITNNAILQQLGFMAVTLFGIGRAVSKDPELFQAMRGRSARFGRSLQMVAAAIDRTDIDVLRAYVNTLNPAMWLNGAGRARRPARVKALRELARLTERLDRYDRLARLVRRLQADQLWLLEAIEPNETVQRRRLILLHGIRVAVIQRICILATEIPSFSPQLGVSRDDILARIMELDVPSAVERLRLIFPHQDGAWRTRSMISARSRNTDRAGAILRGRTRRAIRADAEAVRVGAAHRDGDHLRDWGGRLDDT